MPDAPSAERYPIPASSFRCEIEIERSRFITTVEPIACSEAAEHFIARIRSEFPDANHNCWAYLVGPPGSSDRSGMSDDGEPHGCAGKPMLTTLLHGGVGDTAVVVTRYFGGTKLGKGGMVKAYTRAVQEALQQMPRAERIDWRRLSITLAYPLLSSIERQFASFEVEILDQHYTERVRIDVRLPREHLEAFLKQVTDVSGGQAEVAVIDQEYGKYD